MKKFTKEEAIIAADAFLKEVIELQNKHGLSFNSDDGDIYLSFKVKNPTGNHWDHVNIGWTGDGSDLRVTEVIKDDEYYKKQALEKLSPEELKALGL